MNSDSARAERFLMHLEPLQGALEAYCRQALYDPAVMEDVLQDALVDAFRDFHLYVESTNFRAWIFRYLNLEILEKNRQLEKTRHQEKLPEKELTSAIDELVGQEQFFQSLAACPDAVLEQCDEVLADAVRELGSQERSVLLLRAIGEFRYSEIAEILEVPVGTVMSSLSRTRDRLRQRLADYGRRHGLLKGDL